LKSDNHHLRLAATDLSNQLACRHLTTLERASALGLVNPPARDYGRLESLRERGVAHELAYLDHLRSQGLRVELVNDDSPDVAVDRTLALIRQGVDVIAQGALFGNPWFGRPDVLLRVDEASSLGAFSYEVADTKLSQQTKAGTILQLCLYSELLGSLQGRRPNVLSVVIPGRAFEPERYRLAEIDAYYRAVESRFRDVIARDLDLRSTYPLPTDHCDLCRWWPLCDRRWRDDDHPTLVAGLSVLHSTQLANWAVSTVVQLANLPDPFPTRPERGSISTYLGLREQAKLQVASRGLQVPRHEIRTHEPGKGLERLPEVSCGDIFLDFEAARFVEPGGMEYLLGWSSLDSHGALEYHASWALNRQEEQSSFEAFVDTLTERRQDFPTFHVFHFGAYDLAALKRLATRHSTREEELDVLLREERFVDLHAVLRQGVRVGVESYSLKAIECCYGFARLTELRAASQALGRIESALEYGLPNSIGLADRTTVQDYNREDCESAFLARAWLEGLRCELVNSGVDVLRPSIGVGKPSEKLDEQAKRARAVASSLLAGLPADISERSLNQQAQVLLALNLEWHRREGKVSWWEFFRLAELDDAERFEDPAAISGLEFLEEVPGGTVKCPIHRYRIPPQEVDLRGEPAAYASAKANIGTIVQLDREKLFVDIKKAQKSATDHPSSVFLHTYIGTSEQAAALLRLGEWVAQNSIDNKETAYRSSRDLLLRVAPRGVAPSDLLPREGETDLEVALRVVAVLDHGVLPVQGPPGAGKTYTGARMILEMVRKGRKVGITATSHKVIRNLLDEVVKAGVDSQVSVACVQKVGSDEGTFADTESILVTDSNTEALKLLKQGAASVFAGTAWMWARADFASSVDVLVIDEAGQFSLANALAVAQGAPSLILLGDPQQLEQPSKAAHPDDSDPSALEYLLDGHETIPPDRGLFLAHTWRMHPRITRFTSEQFYEDRLDSVVGLEIQAIAAPGLSGPGLYSLSVEHSGNQNRSCEEADVIAELLRGWFAAGATWTDKSGGVHALALGDILVVAPYNVQVAALAERLPIGARIGTVDKFQGQEAPVVFYSMTSSSPEEAPRGMQFLYSRHRLNVATSRARCACVLVYSPRLLQPDCRTPRQIQLANSLCRYVELATPLENRPSEPPNTPNAQPHEIPRQSDRRSPEDSREPYSREPAPAEPIASAVESRDRTGERASDAPLEDRQTLDRIDSSPPAAFRAETLDAGEGRVDARLDARLPGGGDSSERPSWRFSRSGGARAASPVPAHSAPAALGEIPLGLSEPRPRSFAVEQLDQRPPEIFGLSDSGSGGLHREHTNAQASDRPYRTGSSRAPGRSGGALRSAMYPGGGVSPRLSERLNQILPKVLAEPFLQGSGLGNEIAFHIFDYPPEAEIAVREHILFLIEKIPLLRPGTRVHHLNLFDFLLSYLEKRGLLNKSFEMQRTKGNAALAKALRGVLQEEKLAVLLGEVARPAEIDLLLISGVGSAYPLIRSHTLLNALHSVMGRTPLVLFYPGRYDGTSLRLFDKSGLDDRSTGNGKKSVNYYRAFRLVQ
jgi:predicted RecB family nuclease